MVDNLKNGEVAEKNSGEKIRDQLVVGLDKEIDDLGGKIEGIKGLRSAKSELLSLKPEDLENVTTKSQVIGVASDNLENKLADNRKNTAALSKVTTVLAAIAVGAIIATKEIGGIIPPVIAIASTVACAISAAMNNEAKDFNESPAQGKFTEMLDKERSQSQSQENVRC